MKKKSFIRKRRFHKRPHKKASKRISRTFATKVKRVIYKEKEIHRFDLVNGINDVNMLEWGVAAAITNT